MNAKASLVTALIAAGTLTATAHAIPVTWELDAALQSGGQMSGSFVFDADTAACSDIHIAAESPIVGSHIFTRNAWSCEASGVALVDIVYAAAFGSAPYMMTNAGGPLPLTFGYFGSADDASGVRVASGSLRPYSNHVPEPSPLWLLAIALAVFPIRLLR